MDTYVNFRLLFEGSDNPTELKFTKDELLKLERFLEYARYIESAKLTQMGMPFSFKLHWQEGKCIEISVTLPDWELVEAFLHRLRPILLQKEETNFLKICNLLLRRIELPIIRKAIKEEIELYRGANIYNTMRLSINDELLTSEQVFQDYLNAFEYHRDDEKRDKLEWLKSVLPLEQSRALLFWLLQEKGGAILRIADFIRVIIDTFKGTESPKIRFKLLAFGFPTNDRIQN